MTRAMDPRTSKLALVTMIVDSYDKGISFFTKALGFELVEDSPSETNDGRPKRWVVLRPPGGDCGLLLARADGPDQEALVGKQMGGRVGFFYYVTNFAKAYDQMAKNGVEFLEEPRSESYGQVVVFKDVFGNKWDLLEPVDRDAEES